MTSTRLEPGQPAPDFTLPDQAGEPFTLSSLRGRKAVVYFYPEAMTPGCTMQACDFRDNLGRLQAAGYEVVGISRDEVPKLAEFAANDHLTFRILSDPDHRVHDLYGAYGEKNLYGRKVVTALRSTFVVDEDGVLTLALYNVKATGHIGMLLKRLRLAA